MTDPIDRFLTDVEDEVGTAFGDIRIGGKLIDTRLRGRIEARILFARALIQQVDACAIEIAAELGIKPDDDWLSDVIWNDSDLQKFLFNHLPDMGGG